mmetsp:Transcript_17246/g.47584  ORF Transcript_17246/g.47584 Transcript_17246/m.47584 type:complete len:206 (+) Transcript_17246:201-818(+)
MLVQEMVTKPSSSGSDAWHVSTIWCATTSQESGTPPVCSLGRCPPQINRVPSFKHAEQALLRAPKGASGNCLHALSTNNQTSLKNGLPAEPPYSNAAPFGNVVKEAPARPHHGASGSCFHVPLAKCQTSLNRCPLPSTQPPHRSTAPFPRQAKDAPNRGLHGARWDDRDQLPLLKNQTSFSNSSRSVLPPQSMAVPSARQTSEAP